jgi:hypothetical protein
MSRHQTHMSHHHTHMSHAHADATLKEFWEYELEPFHHFIPVSADLSDLVEKVRASEREREREREREGARARVRECE